MVLVKMLMNIGPPMMRGSLVMSMASISPSRREVSPAESLRRRAKQLLPRFHLKTVALHPESLVFIFSRANGFIQRKEGARGQLWAPQGIRACPGRPCPIALWATGGSPLVFLSPNSFYIFQNNSPQIFRTFGVVQNRYLRFAPFPVQNSSCRHSSSLCKLCKIREKRYKYCTIMCINSP